MSNTIPSWTTGDRLRKAREESHIGVGDMAERLGVSRNTITNYERDNTAVTVEALKSYSEATGVAAVWLMGLDDDGLDLRSRWFSGLTENRQLALAV